MLRVQQIQSAIHKLARVKFDMLGEDPFGAARLANFLQPRQRFSIMFAMLLPAGLTEERHFAIVPAA
jgi:hypothetical protein